MLPCGFTWVVKVVFFWEGGGGVGVLGVALFGWLFFVCVFLLLLVWFGVLFGLGVGFWFPSRRCINEIGISSTNLLGLLSKSYLGLLILNSL